MSNKPGDPVNTEEPLTNFSECHAGILRRLDEFGELPALLEPALKASRVAADLNDFFRSIVFEHHQEEERELFPIVLASSQPGEERERVRQMIETLTREHRAIEKQWTLVESQVKKLAKGQLTSLDGAHVVDLVDRYRAHARFEEAEFLPLSETILRRNNHQMAALGMSLHMRRQPMFSGYI